MPWKTNPTVRLLRFRAENALGFGSFGLHDAPCVHLLPHLVVCSEVVDLLPEHTRPKVFTDELHDVQLIFEARRVLRQSTGKKQEP